MAYCFLIEALVSLGCLGILHKFADRQKCRPSAIGFLLFSCAATFVGIGYVISGHAQRAHSDIPHSLVFVAAVCGAFASLAILSFQAGLRQGDIATSWLIINLSTSVPTVLSILLYKERVGLRRGFSLTLAVLALVFLWWDWRWRKSTAIVAKECRQLETESLRKKID